MKCWARKRAYKLGSEYDKESGSENRPETLWPEVVVVVIEWFHPRHRQERQRAENISGGKRWSNGISRGISGLLPHSVNHHQHDYPAERINDAWNVKKDIQRVNLDRVDNVPDSSGGVEEVVSGGKKHFRAVAELLVLVSGNSGWKKELSLQPVDAYHAPERDLPRPPNQNSSVSHGNGDS